MNILCNGEPLDLKRGLSVADLVAQLELAQKRIAVELNHRIVPKSQHATTLLSSGDTVEIVHAIGGG